MPLRKMPDMDPKILGQRLRAERDRLGISQDEFGKVGGVSRATQYLYEQGDRMPTLEYLVRVISVGVNLGYLVFGAGDHKRREGLVLDQRTLASAYQLVDEIARDSRGRLLDLEHRTALFQAICAAVAEKRHEEIDWEAVRGKFRKLVA